MKFTLLITFCICLTKPQSPEVAKEIYGYWTKINKREPYNGCLISKGKKYLVEYYEGKKARENFNDLGNIDEVITLEDYKYTIKDSILTSNYYRKMPYYFRSDTLIIDINGGFDTFIKSKNQRTPVWMEKYKTNLNLNS
jgi:hypothetical protein